MKKRKKRLWIFLTILFLLLTITSLVLIFSPKDPSTEMELAREALNAARNAGAGKYALNEYEEASLLYDSAMIYWSAQNDRFFLVRDYDQIVVLADEIISKSESAEEATIQKMVSTSSLLTKGLSELESKVRKYESLYKKLPLPSSVLKAHNTGSLKLSEAKIAFENERYNEAEKNFQQALELINSSNEKAKTVLSNWFSSYSKWSENKNEAVRLSKNGQKVILIDKYAHKCYLWQNGKQTKTFEVELGVNWIGDKQKKGDKATPEGIYKVTQKKDGSHTKYHKALLINYPNDEDKRRKATGSAIEIHGTGGKGVDWTDGCVALENSEMDQLYKLVSVGTPVIIVGSIKTLAEITGSN